MRTGNLNHYDKGSFFVFEEMPLWKYLTLLRCNRLSIRHYTVFNSSAHFLSQSCPFLPISFASY